MDIFHMPVFMYQSLPPKSFLQSAHHTLQYILPEFSCCRKKFCWNLNLLVYKKPYWACFGSDEKVNVA